MKRSMDKLRVARDGEWARGMDLHDRDHPQEKGAPAFAYIAISFHCGLIALCLKYALCF